MNRLFAFILLVATASAADWPRWRGPAGNGITPETVAVGAWDKEGPRRLWKANVGVGFTAATVAGDRVYAMGHVGGLGKGTANLH